MKSTSTRCALLDELRGLDLISMMLYHGMWDLVYLFGVSAPWYGSWQGRTVAAIHLLGVPPAVRLLPAAGPPPGQTGRNGVRVRRACHGGHADLHACGCRLVRRAVRFWVRL